MGQDAGGSHAGIRQGRVRVEGRAVAVRRRARSTSTSDAHRLNDYETHIWVSNDFGATFRSLNGNLKGEAVKTLTEDQKNPDVLYAGTETGHLRLARSRQELVAADGATSRTCAWTRSRCIRATTRCWSRRTAASHLDPRSPRADSGVHGGAGRGRREAVLDRSGAAVAVSGTTRTTSSGGISSSSARTRRPTR